MLYEGVLVIMRNKELKFSCQTHGFTLVYIKSLEKQKKAENKWNSLHVFTFIGCFYRNKLTVSQIRSNKLVIRLRVALLEAANSNLSKIKGTRNH